MKKVWSKIGKGIKKVFMKIGKFMNKIGVVGQIALGLILPGIGSALGAWAGTASSTVFGAAAKGFVNAAINIGTKVGSVFKTVTQGVTKVVGETVGAVLNKIPGASDLIKNVTGKLGINAGQGINIADKTFTTAFKTAGQAITDSISAGTDLFSMDTLVGKNKFAVEAMKSKVAEAIPTSGNFSKAGIDTFDSTRPQMSGLTDGDTTNAFTEISKPDSIMAKPTTVEKVVTETVDDSFIGKLKTGVSDGKEYLGEKAGSIIPDAIDQTAKTITDLPSNLIKKEFGIIGPAKQGNVYSSQPAQFTAVGIGADSMLMNTGAIQQDMSAGLQGMFGHPSAIFNDQQATEDFKQRAVGYGGGF